jgi:hypothetical protein
MEALVCNPKNYKSWNDAVRKDIKAVLTAEFKQLSLAEQLAARKALVSKVFNLPHGAFYNFDSMAKYLYDITPTVMFRGFLMPLHLGDLAEEIYTQYDGMSGSSDLNKIMKVIKFIFEQRIDHFTTGSCGLFLCNMKVYGNIPFARTVKETVARDLPQWYRHKDDPDASRRNDIITFAFGVCAIHKMINATDGKKYFKEGDFCVINDTIVPGGGSMIC